GVMSPRDVLVAWARLSAEPKARQRHQSRERAAVFRTHHDRGTKSDLPRLGQINFVEGGLPGSRDFDAEHPRIRYVRFVAAEDTHVVAPAMKRVGQQRSDVTRPAGNHHLHTTSRDAGTVSRHLLYIGKRVH